MKPPRWWTWVTHPSTIFTGIETVPVDGAFPDYMREQWDREMREKFAAEGRVAAPDAANRAPELGPGLGGSRRVGLGDAMREQVPAAGAVQRSPRRRTAPEPLLVIHPNSFPGDEMCQQLNDRGYSILIAPPAEVRVFGDPSQVFTRADVDLCLEFAKLDEADTEHAKLMKVAAESLAKRIDDALRDGAP